MVLCRKTPGAFVPETVNLIQTLANQSVLAIQNAELFQELKRSGRELEALSSKLAKYLAPQVYASIFSGRQEVRLASQRKKLSVLFCDLVGFTETTERLESEDLTQLLNNYLTEMSRLALDHGATVDKYIGDAIMMFFGDPESRGVKEDALACVRAALAMQRRMRELGEFGGRPGWRRRYAAGSGSARRTARSAISAARTGWITRSSALA